MSGWIKQGLNKIGGENMRFKRLIMEQEKMLALDIATPMISIDFGNAPEKYVVNYNCKGLLWLPGAPGPSVTTKHTLEIILHLKSPRVRPQLQWLTDIFHPNILPPSKNGGVCIGQWSPAETLDKLCIRVGEMVQMKSYNIDDALDQNAALWARENQGLFPVDNRSIVNT